MATLLFVGQFVASKIGKTGLTVTVDVDRYALADGSRTALITGGSATEGRRGLYAYRLAGADLSLYQYVATFVTADSSVDQREVAALGLVVPDELISSRAAGSTALSNAVWTDAKAAALDAAVSSRAVAGDDMGLTGAALADVADAVGDGVAVNASVAISATQAAAVASGRIAVRTHHTFSQVILSDSQDNLNGLNKLWFAIKRYDGDPDERSLLLIEKTAGALYVAGEEYASGIDGAIEIAGSAGAWEITVKATATLTSLLSVYRNCPAEIKGLKSTGTVVLWSGFADISRGVIRATA